jgi:hypothetical protein
MSKVKFLLPTITTFTILILAWLFLFYIFYPGFMSYDSVVQYDMGRMLILSDDHPIFVALIWHLASYFSKPPAFMLALNLTLCFGSLHLLSRQVLNRRRLSLCLVLMVIFFPPLLGMQGIIWKDIFMQNFVLLSVALMLFNQKQPTPNFHICFYSLFALFLATLCRHNAIALAIPLVFMNIQIMKPILNRKILATNFLWSIFVLFLFVFINSVGTSLIATKKHFWQTTMSYDIAGASFYKGKNLFYDGYQEIIHKETTLEDIQKRYSPRDMLCLYLFPQFRPSCKFDPILDVSTNPFDLVLVRKNWTDVVVHHFPFYLKHRMGVIGHLMGFNSEPLWKPITDGIEETGLEFTFKVNMNSIRTSFIKFIKNQSTHWYYRPYFYLFASLLIFLFSLRKLNKNHVKIQFPNLSSDAYLLFCLNLSALLYTFSYFLATMSPDYRYSSYLILMTTLSLGILFFQKIEQSLPPTT